MNKEEHLWEMMSDNKYTTRDLRLWVCEALAERDAAREESKVLNDFVNKLKTIINSDNDSMISLNGILNAVLALKESKAQIQQTETAAVVGGVTNQHLGAIASAFGNLELTDKAFRAAREAIKKQKSVDSEAIREVARRLEDHGLKALQNTLLRAIRDEPAEAPDPFARDIQGNLIPQAEPTMPAQKQEGLFVADGKLSILEQGSYLLSCPTTEKRDRVLGMLSGREPGTA